MILWNFCRSVIFTTMFKDVLHVNIFSIFISYVISVWWDVKWCPVSRIATPLARKRAFHSILTKSRLVRAARKTSKFQNWSLLTNGRRRNMAHILPIWRTINRKSIPRLRESTIAFFNHWNAFCIRWHNAPGLSCHLKKKAQVCHSHNHVIFVRF